MEGARCWSDEPCWGWGGADRGEGRDEEGWGGVRPEGSNTSMGVGCGCIQGVEANPLGMGRCLQGWRESRGDGSGEESTRGQGWARCLQWARWGLIQVVEQERILRCQASHPELGKYFAD